MPKYIAMNRFRIAPGREAAFEEMWRSRESYLSEVPGFEGFHLLRGPSDQSSTLYASHTIWDSRESCERYRSSDVEARRHEAMAP